jgi:5-formyltetrahydrofolate cyclo-ligase
MMGLNEEKDKIREEMKRKRDSLTAEDAEKLSAGVAFQLSKMSRYANARTVLFFAAKGKEVQTKSLILKALRSGKKVLLPITNMAKEKLEIAEIRNYDTDLKIGSFGIPEPVKRQESASEKIDLVIVPGLAFGRDGNRIGYGLGFYDKLLPELKEINPGMKSIGLAYNFQVLDRVPRNELDWKVDVIITETSIIVSENER